MHIYTTLWLVGFELSGCGGDRGIEEGFAARYEQEQGGVFSQRTGKTSLIGFRENHRALVYSPQLRLTSIIIQSRVLRVT
jgi:hypothetical protein